MGFIDGFRMFGLVVDKCCGIVSFDVVGVSVLDIVFFFDCYGVVVRVGYYCVMLLY